MASGANGKACPPGLVEVLDYVRRHSSCTRAELVAATGFSRALVGQRLDALVGYGLVAEDGVAPSTGGRAPRRVRFRADAGHLLVADLGATSIDVAVADLAGGILEQQAEPPTSPRDPRAVLARVEALFDEALVRTSPPGPLLGIGVGVPGPVEFHAGRPISPPIMPGWDGYGVPERLGRYGVPVWIDNDVNVMAPASCTSGIGRGRDNFVFVKIGTGIGAGIVLRGELHRRRQGCAGDIGHVQVPVRDRGRGVPVRERELPRGARRRRRARPRRRGCGARRTSPFLRGVLDEQGSVGARDVTLGAAHGDATSVELLANAGRFVGQVVATMVNVFNPSLVVIGGGVAGAGDGLLADDPPDGLPTLAAALDPEPRGAPLGARRARGRRRRRDDGRERAVRSRVPAALARRRRAHHGRGLETPHPRGRRLRLRRVSRCSHEGVCHRSIAGVGRCGSPCEQKRERAEPRFLGANGSPPVDRRRTCSRPAPRDPGRGPLRSPRRASDRAARPGRSRSASGFQAPLTMISAVGAAARSRCRIALRRAAVAAIALGGCPRFRRQRQPGRCPTASADRADLPRMALQECQGRLELGAPDTRRAASCPRRAQGHPPLRKRHRRTRRDSRVDDLDPRRELPQVPRRGERRSPVSDGRAPASRPGWTP